MTIKCGYLKGAGREWGGKNMGGSDIPLGVSSCVFLTSGHMLLFCILKKEQRDGGG